MALFHVMNSMPNDNLGRRRSLQSTIDRQTELRDRACGAQMGGQVVDAEYDVSPPTWVEARDKAGRTVKAPIAAGGSGGETGEAHYHSSL